MMTLLSEVPDVRVLIAKFLADSNIGWSELARHLAIDQNQLDVVLSRPHQMPNGMIVQIIEFFRKFSAAGEFQEVCVSFQMALFREAKNRRLSINHKGDVRLVQKLP
jgi:hypothetical protein